jgi:multiple antibiotic resistance protein
MRIHDLLLHSITVFMGFFAMLNPLGNLPVFLGMVEDFDDRTQKKVARRSVTVAFFIVLVFSAFGHFIFRMFGITLPAFQIAGGIIVFIMGYQLLNARDSTFHSQAPIAREDQDKLASDMAITPLGTPLLAGPGTISAAMNFVGEQKSILNALLVVGIFAVMCVITYFLFISGKYLARRLNPGILKVITRLMGLILTVIAVQMLVFGIQGSIEIIQKTIVQ